MFLDFFRRTTDKMISGQYWISWMRTFLHTRNDVRSLIIVLNTFNARVIRGTLWTETKPGAIKRLTFINFLKTMMLNEL